MRSADASSSRRGRRTSRTRLSAEPTRLTYELSEGGGFTRLTLVHELEGAPLHAEMVAAQWTEGAGGGWSWILSDLKSFLETGETLAG